MYKRQEGVWIAIPDNVSAVYRRLLQVKEDGKIIRNNHLSLIHILWEQVDTYMKVQIQVKKLGKSHSKIAPVFYDYPENVATVRRLLEETCLLYTSRCV